MVFGMGGGNSVEIEVVADGTDAFVRDMATAQSAVGGLRHTAILAGAAIGGIAAAGLFKAAQAASSFEQSVVELAKVTSPEVASGMREELLAMTEVIPLTAEELTGLAADAARFGVRGEENILGFAEAAAKMAIATDLSASEAGEAFARLATLTRTPIEDIDRLGSAINELSNNMATSSQEIVDSMLRSSGALQALGLQNTEMVALSAAVNEVSESSERAGTRLRRFAQELMDPSRVAAVSEALGMTAEEFTRMRDETPTELILRMAEAMRENGAAATSLRGTLSTVSQQTLTALGANIDGTREALDLSGQAYDENESLQREFAAAIDTTAAKFQLLQNRIQSAAIAVGEVLLPAVNVVIDGLVSLFDAFDMVTGESTGIVLAAGLMATAVAGLGVALYALAPAAIAAATALAPILLPIAAIAAAVAGLAILWQSNFAGIQDITSNAMAEIQALIGPTIDNLMETIAVFVDVAMMLWNMFGDEITAVTSYVFGGIKNTIMTVIDLILTTVNVALALLRGDFSAAFGFISDFIDRTTSRWLNFFTSWGGMLLDYIGGLWDSVVSGVHSFGQRMLDALIGIFSAAGEAVSNTFKNAFNAAIPEKVNLPSVTVGGHKLGGDTLLRLPQLAKGGIITSPMAALVGEEGDEAVIPLDRLDRMFGERGGGTTEVVVTLDVPGEGPLNDHIREEARIIQTTAEREQSRTYDRLRGRGEQTNR